MTDVSTKAINIIFNEARTYSRWLNKPVDDDLLIQIYDLMKMGPTSMNCCPARFVFLKSPESKERLKPCLLPGNIEKTMSAPVTAIIAYDLNFYKKMDVLWPHVDANKIFQEKEDLIYKTALRNSSLQGAYFIMAVRSLGLDCGPMSGFSSEKLDKEFFPEGTIKSNFLCNLGYGDSSSLYPRGPRLDFDKVAKII
ncbi:MAG: malonic semialdehyde reductase [Candidatus Paracaedibacteraceae bacterium]|nr:malonic semialdehyde reductase [Candidatus Paracaedibacteraceae bacterium]